MPADDHAAEVAELRERYPSWSIWFGLATRHWWALPPRERDIGDFVEAETPQRLIARIETIRCAPIVPGPRPDVRHPSDLLRLEGAAAAQFRRVPAAVRPGGITR